MLKRFAIALIAAVLLGIVAFLVSRPKPGSVAYHRAGCLAAYHQTHGRETFLRSAKATYLHLRGKLPPRSQRYDEATKLQDKHRAALVRLNYLQERTFFIEHSPFVVEEDLRWAVRNSMDENANQPFVEIRARTPNEITVVCLPSDVPRFAEWVSQADKRASQKAE